MTITTAQFLMMQSRCEPKRPRIKCADDVEREADLHAQIIDECNARGWLFFHGSMAHRSRRTEGEPDFIVLCDGGRVFFVECKDRDGKLSTAQAALHAHARKLGHTVHIIRNIEAFRELTGLQAGVDLKPHHD